MFSLAVYIYILERFFFAALHIGSGYTFPKPLTAKEERECLKLISLGDKGAREKLILHNLRLVAHIIKKYYSGHKDGDDLISIGTIGLIKAVSSFNCDKGVRFATYAARCIENEILMYFRSIKKMAGDVYISDSIDSDSEGNALTLMDIICYDDTIADDLDDKIKAEKLRASIKSDLDEREQKIIAMRYGLDGTACKTQREVAAHLRISRSYVSRIEKKALGILKKNFVH